MFFSVLPYTLVPLVRSRCIEGGRECLACGGVTCHAAGNLSPRVFVLVCLGSSVHLLWFVSVLLGNSVLAVVVLLCPTLCHPTVHDEAVKQVRPCWVAHGRLQDMLVLVLVVASVTATLSAHMLCPCCSFDPTLQKIVRLPSCLDV